MKTEQLIINEDNFEEHFFDVRQHDPEPGHIMACYSAAADLVDGREKRDIIGLLCNYEKAIPTTQVMRKLLFATEGDAYKVPILIAKDLLSGMSIDEVAKKKYRYTIEAFYYTAKENVPQDDPHWSIISLINLDQFLNQQDDRIRSRIVKAEDVSS